MFVLLQTEKISVNQKIQDICLEFKSFFNMNKALLTKLGWHLVFNSDKIWGKIFQHKYGHSNSFILINPIHTSCFIWKGICDIRKHLINGLCIQIENNGNKVNMVHDPWFPRMPNFKPKILAIYAYSL